MAERAATETSTAGDRPGGGEARQRVGTYLYGIVPADVEVAEDTGGVGDPPAPVTVLRHGEIGALVSDLTSKGPLGTPNDLVAHEQLLDATAAEVPVLPIRFGAVMTGPDEIVDELLAPHHDEFRSALEELEGRAEYVVRGRYEERAVLAEVLEEYPEVARLREQIREQPEEVTRDARIQIGEIVNAAITARREADTQAVSDALAPLCVMAALREATHELDAVHLALLVETERQGELEEAVEELAEQWAGRVGLRLLGPLAPYDFIVTPAAG
ncbi:GvpL/GvpF family gas vesicle protein [Nonomuraea sp. NPDC047897]|uniref:GvpL/GvpF family gas vesicle protein n=1 Tax=Nonomuraea sp. NPDC047897 TaxID=3364346 RepID=UPI00371D0F7E